MIALPATLAPAAPFPLIVAQASAPEFVAPGIRRADYRLSTSDGPLVVHVVAVDMNEPTVRFGAVVAHDRMVSAGETVSSMARRTRAVAGINADYFDITQTNQPLNVVVRDGVLQRTPSKRVALMVGSGRDVTIGSMTFAGTVTGAFGQRPLTTVNEWPPQGGVALVTPAYGALPATADVQIARIEPLDTISGLPGTYRVSALGPAEAGNVTGALLGFGKAARALGPLPALGETLQLAFDTAPSFSTLDAAVGGGPLLVANGLPVDDPNSPAPEERDVRFPVAGALRRADGSVVLVVVDGRRSAISIGVTRPQFGALLRAFGAVDAMAFDSGGSATLVARVAGDGSASVVNDPSDGVERPVADGLFAYSDASTGVHPHLIVRPSSFATLPGADPTPELRAAIVDDAGHLLRAAVLARVRVDASAGDHVATVRDASGSYRADVAYRTVGRIARLAILAAPSNPAPAQPVTLDVAASDESGQPIATAGLPLRWTIDGVRSVRTASAAVAATHDIAATVALAGATASIVVRVGSHAVALPFAECALAYDLTGTTRASYLQTPFDLPGEPASFAIDVFGDASGVPLRAAFANRYGERHALTLAKHVDWTGWQRVTVALPPDLTPPVRLLTLYVVPSLGGPAVRVAGTLRFRMAAVNVPGMR